MIQRAYRRHRDRHALAKMIAIKKLIEGNVLSHVNVRASVTRDV